MSHSVGDVLPESCKKCGMDSRVVSVSEFVDAETGQQMKLVTADCCNCTCRHFVRLTGKDSDAQLESQILEKRRIHYIEPEPPTVVPSVPSNEGVIQLMMRLGSMTPDPRPTGFTLLKQKKNG